MDLLSLIFRSGNSVSRVQEGEEEEEEEEVDVSGDAIRDSSATKNGEGKKVEKQLETIGLDEVAWHDTPGDCWLVIYDYVYDCTDFLSGHPGGRDVLLEYAGRDATLAFVGTGHTKAARQILERCLIGELPLEERIFRIPGGVKITDS